MFLTLFYLVLSIFLMMLPGYVARRRAWMGDEGALILSRIMVYTLYPCLIFTAITGSYGLRELAAAWLLPASSAGIMLTGYAVGRATLLFTVLVRGEQRKAFLFQTLMNNYSFFPLALVAPLYGEAGVAALVFSTLGAEAVVWTLGAMTLSGARIGRESLRHLVSPPLAALYAAVACLALLEVTGIGRAVLTEGGGLLYHLHRTMAQMGACTVPVAMIVAGARMATLSAGDVHNRRVWVLTALRLVVIPLAAVGLLYLLPLSPQNRAIMTIVAVMPCALASLVLSELFGGDKELICGSVLLTHVLAIITVPVLLALLL